MLDTNSPQFGTVMNRRGTRNAAATISSGPRGNLLFAFSPPRAASECRFILFDIVLSSLDVIVMFLLVYTLRFQVAYLAEMPFVEAAAVSVQASRPEEGVKV